MLNFNRRVINWTDDLRIKNFFTKWWWLHNRNPKNTSHIFVEDELSWWILHVTVHVEWYNKRYMTVLSQSFVTLVSSSAFRISIIRSKNVFCVFSLPYCHSLMVNYLAQFVHRVSQFCYIILTCEEKFGNIWFEKNSIKGSASYTTKSIIL